MKKISKPLFYILSFTWGLPMSLIGSIVFLFLAMFGCKFEKWGHSYYATIGKGTRAMELGCFFVVGAGASDNTKNHELGHAYQNACIWGWLMPFAVCIPSFTRCCWRILKTKIGKPPKTDYYSVWFEKQASEIGNEVMNNEK